jgi:tRNA-dihydrouridine synthase
MTDAVQVPVTVKMRAGWDEQAVNAPLMARMMEDAGASAVAVHGRTAKQSYKGMSDWELIDEVAGGVRIPVFGSGDCVTPEHVVGRMTDTRVQGVLVGRGALRNPWIFRQAQALRSGEAPPDVTDTERGQFLLEYIDLLVGEGVGEDPGFRHAPPGSNASQGRGARSRQSHERWVVNKLRALGSWYTKGLRGGSRLRTAINSAGSVAELREIIEVFFVHLEDANRATA